MPFLNHRVIFRTRCFLWRNGRDVEARVSSNEHGSKVDEVLEATRAFNLTKGVFAENGIRMKLTNGLLNELWLMNGDLHNSVILGHIELLSGARVWQRRRVILLLIVVSGLLCESSIRCGCCLTVVGVLLLVVGVRLLWLLVIIVLILLLLIVILVVVLILLVILLSVNEYKQTDLKGLHIWRGEYFERVTKGETHWSYCWP